MSCSSERAYPFVSQVQGTAVRRRTAEMSEVASLTRKVIFLSHLFAILAVVEALEDFLSHRLNSFGWMLISLVMPYCGYYGAQSAICVATQRPLPNLANAGWHTGAKNKDRNMLCMFYSVNLVLSVSYSLWILLMAWILSKTDSYLELCDTCHNYTVPVCNTAQGMECSRHGIECGSQVASGHATTTNANYEAETEEDEVEELEGTAPQRSPCDAWEALHKSTTAEGNYVVYWQILTYLVQIILACAAFSFGRRLACHRNFGLGGVDTRRTEAPARRASRNATQPQVLQACVVQPIPFEPDMPRLAPGEVMGTVHIETNPVAGCASASVCPTQPATPVVMATPIPR